MGLGQVAVLASECEERLVDQAFAFDPHVSRHERKGVPEVVGDEDLSRATGCLIGYLYPWHAAERLLESDSFFPNRCRVA